MALITCPECNASISDKANVCIKCGFPIKKDMTVMISFPVCPGQIFNNYCYVYHDKEEIASAKQGETVTIECHEPMRIEVKCSGFFGKPSATISPGERYKVETRGFGTIYLSKVDSII